METRTAADEAKRIYIAYVQLVGLLSELRSRLQIGVKQDRGHWWAGSPSYAKGFNAILETTKDAFKIDEHFLEAIKDIEAVEEGMSPDIFEQVLSRGSKLKGALQAFVNLHMSGEDKRQIGFTPYTESSAG